MNLSINLPAALAVFCAVLAYLAGQRVNLFVPRRHKLGWGLMYIAWAAGFMGLALHQVAEAVDPTHAAHAVDALLVEAVSALAIGSALNLLLTYEQWRFNMRNGHADSDVPRIAHRGAHPGRDWPPAPKGPAP